MPTANRTYLVCSLQCQNSAAPRMQHSASSRGNQAQHILCRIRLFCYFWFVTWRRPPVWDLTGPVKRLSLATKNSTAFIFVSKPWCMLPNTPVLLAPIPVITQWHTSFYSKTRDGLASWSNSEKVWISKPNWSSAGSNPWTLLDSYIIMMDFHTSIVSFSATFYSLAITKSVGTVHL